MNINMELSEKSIGSAIRKLERMVENLDEDVSTLVHLLTQEGAEEAQRAFGSMASVSDERPDANTGVIKATAKAMGVAEFGAGYATMEYHPFADNAPYDVEVASYSRSKIPQGLFYTTHEANPGEGYWVFGGMEYDRVQPRHGLLNAYDFIMARSTDMAREVLKLD